MKRIGRIALKTVLWILASIIFLVLLIIVLIQVPSIQNFLKDKAVTFIEGKIHTKVKIGHFSLGLPKLIVLDSVYFEDQKKDTLLAGDKLKVDISMFKLLHGEVEVNEIDLEGITANISRGKDSVFNFGYILKAFAGEQKKPVKPADTTSSMKFSVGSINLDRINVSYKDAISGFDVKFILGHFDTHIKDFDMDKMKFTIPKITLSGVDTRIIQSPAAAAAAPAPVDTAVKPINMNLTLGTIDISKIKVDYRTVEMAADVNLGKLLVEMNKIDLKNQVVGIKTIELNDTRAGLTLAKPKSVVKEVVKTVKKLDTLVASPKSQKGWTAVLDKMSFANDNVKFDNNAQNQLPKGLDFNHMDIRNLDADIERLSYSADAISGRVNTFTFSEKSGLAIKRFHTSFFYGPKSAYLKDLYVETPQSVIQKQVQVGYPSIASLTKDLGKLSVNANLDGSRLGFKDVLLLMPSMATMDPFKRNPNAVFRIDGRINGTVGNLNIANLEVRGLSNTHIKASAKMRGLPNINKSYFDVNIADFNTSGSDIDKLVSPGVIPSSFSIPSALNLKGTFKGSMYNFETKLGLRTTDGAADLDATLKNGNSKENAAYTANIKANELQVGKLIKQPENVGAVTLTAEIKGEGLDPKKADVQFSGDVVQAEVKGYNYQHLLVSGTAKEGKYTAKAKIKDPAINFSLDGDADMTGKYPAINATLNVDSINLQKLNFSKDPLEFHGKIVAKVPTADPDYLNADVLMTNLLVSEKTQTIRIDSISLKSTANADSSTLKLKMPMMYAHMAGKYKLTQLGPAMTDFIDKYFNRNEAAATAKAKPTYSPQEFSFDIHLVKSPMAPELLPDLKKLDPILITGHFNSQTGDLTVKGNIPNVVYGTTRVKNVKLDVNTANSALNYSLVADEIKASSSLDLLYTGISGNAKNDKLNISFDVRDAKKKPRYHVAGIFTVLPNEYQFSLAQNGLMLNYVNWTVNRDNAFQFGSKGIMAHDFTISSGGQQFSVNSDTQELNAPLTIDFKNFKIETLAAAAKQDSLQAGGTISGNAHISDFEKAMKFTAALNINDFSFRGDTVGNIAIKVNNQTENAYNADVTITGKGNDVHLYGNYYTNQTSQLDLTLDIKSLATKSIEGFSFGSLKNGHGDISGQLKIAGNTSAPSVRGNINFNKVGFNVAMLNSYFIMPKESITFNNDGILFNDFTMVDSLGNKAIVTGTVYTKTYTDFGFGIDITADDFRVINSTQENNKLYYGKLYVDSRIKIRGTMKTPVVDATITVNDKTDLTIVLPQDDPGIEDRKGVVEVINPNMTRADSVFLAKQLDSLRKSSVSGMDVSATIRIKKEANFTIMIDPRNGDVVQIKGAAQLNGGIDPSGKISLTGTYTVEQGSYNLSYAAVKRKFIFKKGSTITWNGDPTLANLDITAIYVAKVPPIDLVSNQLGDTQNATQYKQKLPFNIDLILKNDLLKPDISFDIVLPDSSYSVGPEVVATVNTRLAQVRTDPNELNKQVLGVLVLGHFIGENALTGQAGSTYSDVVRNSVSALLSDQLNRLAGDIVGGIQLNFEVTSGEDYSSGTAQNRTDLNVGLSKQFLNDRLTVTVGNNFNLEGAEAPGQKSVNIAGDVQVNYKLSKDGRYMVRVFRKDQYIVIEGQVVQTGVGFSLVYDYNHLKELFAKKTPEEKEEKKQYKEEQKEQKQQQKTADKKADSVAKQSPPIKQPK